MVDSGIIKTGYYSKNGCNRTTWYALGENYAALIWEKSQMELGKIPNAFGNDPKSYNNNLNNIIILNTDKDTDICAYESAVGKSKRERFIPPSVEEVTAYISEKGYTDVDAEQFIAHYESNGWKVGRNPMKDWKAAVRSWAARRKNDTRQKQNTSDGWDYIAAVARGETT